LRCSQRPALPCRLRARTGRPACPALQVRRDRRCDMPPKKPIWVGGGPLPPPDKPPLSTAQSDCSHVPFRNGAYSLVSLSSPRPIPRTPTPDWKLRHHCRMSSPIWVKRTRETVVSRGPQAGRAGRCAAWKVRSSTNALHNPYPRDSWAPFFSLARMRACAPHPPFGHLLPARGEKGSTLPAPPCC
jgi:hypothetical protein